MANEEETRSQYLQALQKQRQALSGNGSVLVNPSVSNNVDELASMDTSFNFAYNAPVREKELQEIMEEPEKRKDNAWTDIVSFFEDVTHGFLGAVEGIGDFLLTGGSAIAGAFGANTENFDNFIETDWSGQLTGGLANAVTGQGWDTNWVNTYDTGFGRFIGGIGHSIGAMLPSIAVGAVTGGAGLLPTLTFGLGAAGTSAQEALQEGKTTGQSLLYGALTGAIETATERIGGFIPGESVAVRSIGDAVRIFGNEAFEEVLSGVVEPIKKAVSFQDKDELKAYKDMSFWLTGEDSLVMQGLAGGVAGLAMGGGQTLARSISMGQYAKPAESLIDMKNLATERNEFAKEFNIRDKFENMTDTEIYSKLEEKGMSEKDINKYIKLTNDIASKFTEFESDLQKAVQSGNQRGLEKFASMLRDPVAFFEAALKSDNADLIKDLTQGIGEELTDQNRSLIYERLDARNKEFGTNVTLSFSNKIDGEALVQGNKIILNPDYAGKWTQAFEHEWGHVVEEFNPETTRELADIVNSTEIGKELAKAIQSDEVYSQYEVGSDEYNQELVNKYLEEILDEKKGRSEKLYQKLFPKNVFERLAGIFSDVEANEKNKQFVKKFRQLQNEYRQAEEQAELNLQPALSRDTLKGRYTIGDNNLAVTVKRTTEGYDIYENGKVVTDNIFSDKDIAKREEGKTYSKLLTAEEVKRYLEKFNAKKVVAESSSKESKPKSKKESKANYYREKAVLGKWVINGESREQESLFVEKFEGKFQVLSENKGEIFGEFDTVDEVKKYMEEANATKYKSEGFVSKAEKSRIKVGSKDVVYSKASNGDILASTLHKDAKGEWIITTKNETTGEIKDKSFGQKYKQARAAISAPISATNNREDLFKKNKVSKEVTNNKTVEEKASEKTELKEYFKTVKTTEQIIRTVKAYIEGNADNKIKVAFPRNFDNFVSKTFTEINSVKSVDLEAQKVVDLLLDTTIRDYDEIEGWTDGKKLRDIISTADIESIKEKVVDLIESTDTEIAKTKDTRPFEVTLDRVIDKAGKNLSKTKETRILRGLVDSAKKKIPNTVNTTKESVARSGVDFLKLLVKDLHAEGGSTYSQKGVIENANAIREMYQEIGKNQSLYPDIPFYQEIIDQLDAIIDSIGATVEQNGKEITSHMTAYTERLIIDYAHMVDALSKQVKENIIQNYKPSAIQSAKAIEVSKYGTKTNISAILFRKYKRGFAPAYTVLREILGGNSRAAEVLTTDYQNAQNNKILYVGAYSDEINNKLKEFGIKKAFKRGSFQINGHTLSTDQALGLYISLNVDANYQAIDESGAKFINENGRTALLANKNNAATLKAEIEKVLPDNYKKFGNWLLSTMNDSVKSEYINWYEERFGKYNNRNEIGAIKENKYWMLSRAYNQMSSVEKAVTNPLGIFSNAKSRVGFSDNEVMIGGALSGFTTYIDRLGTELYLKPQYREALAILNTKLDDSNKTIISLMTERLDPQDRTYLKNTMDDMVGVLEKKEDIFTAITSRFSVAKLSLNIGSMLKQYASMWTSNIPFTKSTQGLIARITNKEEYKNEYNKLVDEIGGLKYRESNSTVVKANATNLSNAASKVADVGMIGITKVDKFTISTGVYSLMALGENQFGYKVGTKENIDFVKEQWHEFELSQIGNGALSKNAVSRGDYKELPKLIFGFLQGANRAGIGSQVNKVDLFLRNRNTTLKEVTDARTKARKAVTEFENKHKNGNGKFEVSELSETDAAKYTQLLADRIDAETKFNDFRKYEIAGGKSIPVNMTAGLIAQGIFVTLINELMKRIKGKKDWDEVDVAELGLNTALAIGIDWVPFVNTISSMVKGYDVQIPAVEIFNEMTDVLSNIKDGNWESSLRELAVLIGDSTGIPFQTLYDYMYGIVKQFDVGVAYEMNSVLYGSSASTATKTLNIYVSKNNSNKVNSMMKVVMNNYRVNSTDDVIKEISRIYMDGEKDVLPKQFATSYTDESGVEHDIDIKAFRANYDLANSSIVKLINTREYSVLTSAEKAKIIKKVYNTYYDYAMYKANGVVPSSRLSKLLALTNGNIDLANYIIYLQKLDDIVATKTKTRKELAIEYINRIRGLNRQEKMIVMVLAGYSVAEENKQALRNYLRSKGMSIKDANEYL